jgi:putative ABC transport system ATP-binding protein
MTVSAMSLSKSFSGAAGVSVNAVRSVALECDAGEFVIIGGPNGGGKTTLLTLLGCMSRPSSGALSIAGTDVLKLSQQELSRFRGRSIGFIFQTFRLLDVLTARENIELAADCAGTGGAGLQSRVTALMEEVGIAHRARFYPPQLSGGEKQRIAIARALINHPPLILADEPTGSLDSASGQMIVRLLRSTAKERNAAVITVSHDERVYAHADRVLRMEDGTLTAWGGVT